MRPFESLTWCNLSYIYDILMVRVRVMGLLLNLFNQYKVTIIIVNGILFVGTKIILLNDIIIRLDLGYMIHESLDFRYI